MLFRPLEEVGELHYHFVPFWVSGMYTYPDICFVFDRQF